MSSLKTIVLALAIVLLATAAKAQQCGICDVNKDGVWTTVLDYGVFQTAFNKTVGSPGYNPNADLDGNGAVTVQDYGMLLRWCPLGNEANESTTSKKK